MLYISLILIAAGLLCILYPVFTRTEKRRYTPGNDRYVPNFDIIRDQEHSEQDNRIHDQEGEVPDIDPDQPGLLDELDEKLAENAPVSHRESSKSDHAAENAVLYEDSSRMIDYETGSNVIDSTLDEYKKLKRIGKGRIEVYKDGINFFIDKSFYRFDFYKIDRVKMGENYMALFLKGSSVVRLVLFEENASGIRSIVTSIENHFSTAG